MEHISVSLLCLIPGKVARLQAWKLKRLISVFNRVASRGHFPRERAIQRIYIGSGIPLPANPRYLLQRVSQKQWAHLYFMDYLLSKNIDDLYLI